MAEGRGRYRIKETCSRTARLTEVVNLNLPGLLPAEDLAPFFVMFVCNR